MQESEEWLDDQRVLRGKPKLTQLCLALPPYLLHEAQKEGNGNKTQLINYNPPFIQQIITGRLPCHKWFAYRHVPPIYYIQGIWAQNKGRSCPARAYVLSSVGGPMNFIYQAVVCRRINSICNLAFRLGAVGPWKAKQEDAWFSTSSYCFWHVLV